MPETPEPHAQTVSIPTTDGDLAAYVARPADAAPAGGWPGVIVLHELFGLNDDIRGIARRFAANGYVAVAPDLYSVGPRLRPRCIRRTMQALRRGDGRAFDDIEASRAWLARQDDVDPAHLAVVGFCMGGGFALLHAARAPLGAAANFYGAVPRDADQLDGICPVFAGYGEQDQRFRSMPDRLRGHLTQLGVPHEVAVYPDAGHSFMNQAGGIPGFFIRHARAVVGYQHDASEAAWDAMLAFFATHLSGTTAAPDS